MGKCFLDEDFVFTQQSLKTFKDCPLKFKKRYIDNIRWSNPYDAKASRRIENGKNFHLLAYRYFSGIAGDEGYLKNEDPVLVHWLTRLKENFPLDGDTLYQPEYKGGISVDGLKLEATFDLLAISPDKIEIWDWKTHEYKLDSKKESPYGGSMQTKVYLYILKECMDCICPGFEGSLYMNYWQPEIPHLLGRIEYNDILHKQFENEIRNNVEKIKKYDYSVFDKVLRNHCSVCEFNMLCHNEQIDFTSIEDNDFLIPF